MIPAIMAVCMSFSISVAGAGELTPEDKFFEMKVRPLLAEKCWSCHGPEQQKGHLRLDALDHILSGGESGAAIVPEKPDESLLMEAVRFESLEMPPGKKMTDAEIEILEQWIKLGAKWPGVDPSKMAPKGEKELFTAEDRQWWAIQPVKHYDVPQTTNNKWSLNPVDQFLLVKMQEHQLTPAPQAERIILLRRLYYDLTGLPPTPEQTDKFLSNQSPDAYDKLVDELLASPHYGERWARHWLDLVRYADGDGYRADHYRPNAWQYRDYVIKAFNDDKPYNRFVQEQIAGDELFPGNLEAQVATGYYTHGIYEYNNRDVRGQWDTMLNDITNNTADVFMGLGLQCAQCHNHKYDPLLQKDYFRLKAFFAPMKLDTKAPLATPAEIAAHQKKLAEYDAKTKEIQDKIAVLEAKYRKAAYKTAYELFPPEIHHIIDMPADQRSPLDQQLFGLAWKQFEYEFDGIDKRLKGTDKEQILTLRKELTQYASLKPQDLPHMRAASDIGPESPVTLIPKKGKQDIEPGIPSILDAAPIDIAPNTANPQTTNRRTALATWLTDPKNPLTSRVIVNRVWQYHFGQGLTPNASDFGRLGGEPVHPELLDWLTTRFINEGWSIKKLHKWIVTSEAYKMSSNHPDFVAYQKIDPTNLYQWRGKTRRLDAEQIRDGLLMIVGELDQKAGGAGVNSDIPRRSIYTRYMRNSRDPLLDIFDLPLFFASNSERDTTTTPIQSLMLINSPMMYRYSKELATSIMKESSDKNLQVEQIWRRVLGRAPNAAEKAQALQFLNQEQDDEQKQKHFETSSNVITAKLPYRNGQAMIFDLARKTNPMIVSHKSPLTMKDFTIEAYIELRSVADTGTVRTVASKRAPTKDHQGWQFGVTGKGSRRKPQTLVMLLYGMNKDGTIREDAIFSDQLVELNKPYYIAASVKMAQDDSPGSISFYIKDLSNDDEQIQVATIPHTTYGGIANEGNLILGANGAKGEGLFDGLIDEIRLSTSSLPREKLVYFAETNLGTTRGYWRFEPEIGMLVDSSSSHADINPPQQVKVGQTPAETAFIDLCHILLNSNEFLYVP
jgi:hypothetical protein